MIKSLYSIFAFVFVISITNSCFGQELKIFDKYDYKCTRDSTWRGICAGLCIYEYRIKDNNIKIKNKKCTKVSYEYKQGKFILSDSTYTERRYKYPKRVNYILFNKLLQYIFINKEDKLIGMDVRYFFSKNYLNTHTYSEIQDSLCSIKKGLSLCFGEETYMSSISRYLIVETTFKGEKYKLWKSLHGNYWFAQKANSDEPVFKFFYPDWNILINDLIQIPKKYENELRIIHINNQSFDIGRKILIPNKKRKKKHLLEKPSEETTINKLHFFYPKLKS